MTAILFVTFGLAVPNALGSAFIYKGRRGRTEWRAELINEDGGGI